VEDLSGLIFDGFADALLEADNDSALKSNTKMETLSYMPLQFEVPSTNDHPASLQSDKATPLSHFACQQTSSCSGGLLHVDADKKLGGNALHFEIVSTNHHIFSLHYEKTVKTKPLTAQTSPRVIGEPCDANWLNGARAGRAISLFCPCPLPLAQRLSTKNVLHAMYHIDNHITQLRIIPMQDGVTTGPISIGLDDVLVVGRAADFPLFFNPDEERMSDENLQLAIVIQYISVEGRACRLCFLVGTQEEQRLFVSMFSSLCCSQSRSAHRTGEIVPDPHALRL